MESDYTLLYLHHGLTSDNKPSLSWLRDAYREFDRKWVGAWGQELVPCRGGGETAAPAGVNARTLQLGQPGLKSQFPELLALETFMLFKVSEPLSPHL